MKFRLLTKKPEILVEGLRKLSFSSVIGVVLILRILSGSAVLNHKSMNIK